jgi:hypothetical protein
LLALAQHAGDRVFFVLRYLSRTCDVFTTKRARRESRETAGFAPPPPVPRPPGNASLAVFAAESRRCGHALTAHHSIGERVSALIEKYGHRGQRGNRGQKSRVMLQRRSQGSFRVAVARVCPAERDTTCELRVKTGSWSGGRADWRRGPRRATVADAKLRAPRH